MQFKSFLAATERAANGDIGGFKAPYLPSMSPFIPALMARAKVIEKELKILGEKPYRAVPFVFHGGVPPDVWETRDEPKLLDLPFEDVHFEVAGKPAIWASQHDDGLTLGMKGLYVNEISPGRYKFATELFTLVASKNSFGFKVPEGSYLEVASEYHLLDEGYRGVDGDDAYGRCMRLAQAYCEKLRSAHRYSEAVDMGLSYREGKNRKYFNLSSITHVRDLKFQQEYGPFGGKLIFQSTVMGHFRTIKGIGKDRAGARTLSGVTWVVPHTKNKGGIPRPPKPREVHRKGPDEPRPTL